MQPPVISVIYHSATGHTAQLAALLAAEMRVAGARVHLLPAELALEHLDLLNASDTILFGCPTCFGNVSAGFKQFMDATGAFWYRQPWKNKLASAFTVSSTRGGDKHHTLESIFVFASQHGMNWISLGIVPRFLNNEQTDGQNRLGCYTGLMVQCSSSATVQPLRAGDRLTAELFARRVVGVTQAMKPNHP